MLEIPGFQKQKTLGGTWARPGPIDFLDYTSIGVRGEGAVDADIGVGRRGGGNGEVNIVS